MVYEKSTRVESKRVKLPSIYINEHDELVLNSEFLDKAFLEIGDIVKFAYDSNENMLLLEYHLDASILNENFTLAIPKEIGIRLKGNGEFEAMFDPDDEILELRPVNKICLYCGEKEGKKIEVGKYMCEICLEKLKSAQY